MTIPRILSYPMPSASELPANRARWQLQSDRAVLLIHDMQQYFCRFYADDCPLLRALLRHILVLRQYADQHQIPVIYTAQPAEQSVADRALLNDIWGPGLTAADPALAAIVDELAPRTDDIVLTKLRYSAFARSPLQDLMLEFGRNQLLICGVYAHIGIQTTAVDAFMRDIQPFVIGDAVADFDQASHLLALHYLAGRAAALLPTDYFARQLYPEGDLKLLDAHSLTEHVLYLIAEDVAEFSADANLLDYGIDSVQIMAIVAKWREQGLNVDFIDLAEQPTLNAWLALLQSRQQAMAEAV
ncbi:MAG: isochorismatase family protein [Rheinheimera sp.]|nr:isochorismatase family protein [Rheinheimera sp.]